VGSKQLHGLVDVSRQGEILEHLVLRIGLVDIFRGQQARGTDYAAIPSM